jgi:unsaturated chondroitin disaccharide hydrolase
MDSQDNPYYTARLSGRLVARHQQALMRCVDKMRDKMPIIGLRNPKMGRADLSWDYCGPADWVISFYSGQLWLALQLTGDPAFFHNARARRTVFRNILRNRHARDHDLGFQYSLSCVADWLSTADPEARALGLCAAEALLARFDHAGQYIKAWNPRPYVDVEHAAFTAGRMIADTMQNLALLHWAHAETGVADFRDVARAHAQTAAKHLIRPDGTTYHTFVFDPATGAPLRGETHQGFAHESCWSRGQAWMIHGFAQCYATQRLPEYLHTARQLADTAERLMQGHTVPPWDFSLGPNDPAYLDSSAGAVMAAGLYLLAQHCEPAEAQRWTAFADRLLDGLLEQCDVTTNADALGFLDHGASYVAGGYSDTMLPYGDYYFMEALMRSLGHTQFFW